MSSGCGCKEVYRQLWRVGGMYVWLVGVVSRRQV